MKSLHYIALVITILTSAFVKAQDPETVGKTKGDLSVSLTGAATYSVPFTVPQGVNGMTPSVGLVYSSQAGDGSAGWGWNISGLSSITRTNSTMHHDGEINPVDFSETDRFALDGQRLIRVKGKYDSGQSEYKLENYSNIKIIATDTDDEDYGPEKFEVFYPDGTISTYGYLDNARTKMEFLLYKKVDPQGNYTIFSYIGNNQIRNIETIKYGGNLKKGTSHINEIKFNYKTRKVPQVASFFRFFPFSKTKILNNVVIKSRGKVYRKYLLTYDNTKLDFERLVKIVELNTNNKSLSPIVFKYGISDLAGDVKKNTIYANINKGSGVTLKNYESLTGDFDGDGRIDFLAREKSTNDIYIYKKLFGNDNLQSKKIYIGKVEAMFASNYIKSNNEISTSQGVIGVQEIGDSKVSFKTYNGGGTHEYSKTWHSPTYTEYPGCIEYITNRINQHYISGDFNGDGLTDVVAVSKPYVRENCYKDGTVKMIPSDCKCTTYSVDKSDVTFINLDRRKTTNFSVLSGRFKQSVKSNDKLLSADYTGDGKADIIHLTNGKAFVYDLDKSNKLRHVITIENENFKMDKHVFLGDFNGDGKSDFLIPVALNKNDWHFIISTGYNSNYVPSYTQTISDLSYDFDWITNHTPTEHNFIVNDFNGDGKSDILRFIIQQDAVGDNGANQFFKIFSSTPFQESYSKNYLPTLKKIYDKKIRTYGHDGILGGGVPIFIDSNRLNGHLEFGYASDDRIQTYEFPYDHKVETTLENIKNNGVEYAINYSYIQQKDGVYTAKTGQQYPNFNINIAPGYKVVSSVFRWAASLAVTQRDFKYEGAVTNLKGLGFLGFETVKQSNWYGGETDRIWTVYKQDMSKRGATVQQFSSLSDASTPTNVISQTDYTYQTKYLSNKIFINNLIKKVSVDQLKNQTYTDVYTYDAYNNPEKIVATFNGGSKTTTLTYSNNGTAKNNTYHIGRVLKKEVVDVLDGNIHKSGVEMSYDNNLIIKTIKKGNDASIITENFVYDDFGNMTKRTITVDGTSRFETFKYDASGRYLLQSTDIEGLTTTNTYDNNTGVITSIKDPFGLNTSFEYDGWQRIKKETNYLGKVTTHYYSEEKVGGTNCIVAFTDYPEGQDIKKYYNARGWLVREDKLSLNNKWIRRSYYFRSDGKLKNESEPYFVGETSNWTVNTYDEYGRILTVRLPTGKTVTTTYNGNTVTVNDGTKTKSTTYNGANKPIKVVDNGGTITYKYFGNGKMKSASYGSHTVSIERDGWGRKTKLIDPSAGTYTYEYNGFGELTAENTPNGSTYYMYDDFGKLTNKNTLGDNATIQRYYTYDATTKLLKELSSNGNNGLEYKYIYNYDNYKRLSSVKEHIVGKATFEKKLQYDGFGRVKNEERITNAFGTNNTVKISHGFDTASGRLKEIKDTSTNTILWQLNQENAKGQLLEQALGNGHKSNMVYDDYGYAKSLTVGNTTTSVLQLNYNFDAQRGILLDRENKSLNKPWQETFTFDAQDRLTKVNGPKPDEKAYDQRGRVTQNAALGTYNYASSSLYQLKDISLNTKGDLHYQKHKVQDIVYNSFKKPLSIHEEGHGRVNFEYGPLNKRSFAFYGGDNEDKYTRENTKIYATIFPAEIVKHNATNTVKHISYIGGDAYTAPVAHIKQVTAAATTNEVYYLHRDYLGSVLSITNQQGKVEEYRQFGAWGSADYWVNGKYEAITNGGLLAGRGFTGHEHFNSVSLIHMNGRMYDAKLGRFLSPDNYIQNPYATKSFNRYSYVWNNPLSYIDPSGEEIITLGVIIGAIIGAYIGGAMANGDLNPFNWDYSSPSTWVGIGVGAILGAFCGNQIALGNMNVVAAMGVNTSKGLVPLVGAKLVNGAITISAVGGLLAATYDWKTTKKEDGGNNNVPDIPDDISTSNPTGDGISNNKPKVSVECGELVMVSVESEGVTYEMPEYYSLSINGTLGGGIGFDLGIAKDSYGDWGLMFNFNGTSGYGADISVGHGYFFPTNEPLSLDNLKGYSYFYEAGVSTPLGGYGASGGGTVAEGLSLYDYSSYGTGNGGYGYHFGSGSMSMQKPSAKLGVGVVYGKSKTYIWKF